MNQQASDNKPSVLVFSTAYHPFIGGAEVAIEQVARRIGDRFNFVIVTSRMRRDLPRREVRLEGTVIRVGFGAPFDKFLLPVLGVFAVRKLTRSFDLAPDRMIWWGMDLSFGSLTAAMLKFFHPKTSFIFTIQYGYGDERVARGRLGVIGLVFKFILARSDHVTAISKYLKNLVEQYGYIGESA